MELRYKDGKQDVAPSYALGITRNFFICQYHCNLSEDIQQSCLTVTINGM